MQLHAQTSDNEMVEAFRRQVRLSPSANDLNPFQKLNFTKPVLRWYNSRIMDRYLGKVLDERFVERAKSASLKSGKRGKPVVDMAIDTYLEIEGGKSVDAIDPKFKQVILDQVKIFLFAGHVRSTLQSSHSDL